MLQKVSFVLNIVLTIAVIILFVLFFKGDKTADNSAAPILTDVKNLPPSAGIVFVNMDTLMNKFTFVKEAKNVLESTQMSKEKEFERQYADLQQKVERFREIAEGLSQEQAQKEQNELMMREQELMQLREKLAAEIMKKEQDLNSELNKKINGYLAKYKKSMPFNYVLSYTVGGGILYANDSLDVTNQVIEGLNKEHAAGPKK